MESLNLFKSNSGEKYFEGKLKLRLPFGWAMWRKVYVFLCSISLLILTWKDSNSSFKVYGKIKLWESFNTPQGLFQVFFNLNPSLYAVSGPWIKDTSLGILHCDSQVVCDLSLYQKGHFAWQAH